MGKLRAQYADLTYCGYTGARTTTLPGPGHVLSPTSTCSFVRQQWCNGEGTNSAQRAKRDSGETQLL